MALLRNVSRQRKTERGQTLALVAVSIIALLGMAALAIDVVSLYVARGQAERAADAAALAAAKVLADSGVTTDPNNSSASNPSVWTSACALAIIEGTNVASQNEVAGMSPTPSQVTVTFPNAPAADCSGPSTIFGINPQAQVVVQVSGIPTFFARIWNAATSTVKGTALAEAYNPSNSSSVPGVGQTVPIAPRCVKPLLLPNCDPDHGSPPPSCLSTGPSTTFINQSTGAITNPGLSSAGGVIGEQLTLIAACSPCSNPTLPAPIAGSYYPLSISSASSSSSSYVCSNCALPSDPPFQEDLECCNGLALQCGTPSSGQLPTVNTTDSPNNNEALNGAQCLIHGTSTSAAPLNCTPLTNQDCLDLLSAPPQMRILAGNTNPLIGAAPANVQAGDQVTTSSSMVTLALYDGVAAPQPGVGVNIIGYLQAFINYVDAGSAIHVTVINVSGCGGGAGNPPVSGVPVFGAGPPVPVRLISSSAAIGP
jgi:hypothetical protein